MERIVLKHLSGSKANQVEEFPLNHVKELILGRDPSSTVKYDPDRDDLVGRQHAKITQDPNDPSQFIVADMNSRNGTFVNRQRINGSVRVNPGDVVQLGPGGPEFVFEVEPRPAGATKATRVVQADATAPATRVPGGPAPTAPAAFPPGPTAPQQQPRGVGKATVERIVAQNVQQAKKSQSRTYLAVIAVVVVLLIGVAGIGGFFFWRWTTSKTSSDIATLKKGLDEAKATEAAGAAMKPADVVNNYGKAVVKIDVAWKLVSQQGNGLVYHQYTVYNGRPAALYVKVADGSIEPYLTYNSNNLNVGIGGRHTGSGFAVSSDGFILTNRHVAAAWESAYQFPPSADNGILVAQGPDGKMTPVAAVPQAPANWIPSQSKQDGVAYDGRNDHLDVLFAKSERKLSAKLSAVSPRHDVAMIKVDSPGTVPAVEINDNYDSIQAGETAIVLGYPAISAPVYGIVKSLDPMNTETKGVEIPDPTVTVGNIGRIYRNSEGAAGAEKAASTTVSVIGDSYQLQINTTGSGNSGGPVFDDHGRVIAIFYAGLSDGRTAVTFAVPIRYGRELMGKS
ncbi:MAG TPA: trypsin-like peptidase domain-containing protein [Pyrinomonadaceae bacterium]|jgi:S1-C subfamily serine protease/pSer/pThr/pTyr-binding forkhead associated (FHA) protein